MKKTFNELESVDHELCVKENESPDDGQKNEPTKETIRESHKECIEKIGKQIYEFDRNEELFVYKYLNGFGMSKKEWKKYKKGNFPNSFIEWEQRIKKKYRSYENNKLRNFLAYLDACIIQVDVLEQLNNIVFAALASTAFTVICNLLVKFDSTNAGEMAYIIYMLIMIIIVVPGIFVIINSIYRPVQMKKMHNKLYTKYKEIIEEIIQEKEVQDKKKNRVDKEVAEEFKEAGVAMGTQPTKLMEQLVEEVNNK